MASKREIYSARFFEALSGGSQRSAEVIMPYLVDILRRESVLDVGCGTGIWLDTAAKLGVSDLFGIDGEWARPRLVIPRQQFSAVDLEQRFDLGRRFGMVLALEVAEHIDESRTATFIENLVRHADAIVFSAAIPFQGGSDHKNERWPMYWLEHFDRVGYRCYDFLRWMIWNETQVDSWYRQNILIFANTSNANLIDRLDKYSSQARIPPGLSVVHPAIWLPMMNSKRLRAERAVKQAMFTTADLLKKCLAPFVER